MLSFPATTTMPYQAMIDLTSRSSPLLLVLCGVVLVGLLLLLAALHRERRPARDLRDCAAGARSRAHSGRHARVVDRRRRVHLGWTIRRQRA